MSELSLRIERDRYRDALERIRDHDTEAQYVEDGCDGDCAMFMQHIARTALEPGP